MLQESGNCCSQQNTAAREIQILTAVSDWKVERYLSIYCNFVAESYELLGSVKCGEYQNCIAWSPSGGEVFTGGKAGAIVKISDQQN